MKDLISRADAIAALGDEPEIWSRENEYELGINNQWHYDVNALKALPSIEPEIVWCKECIHRGEKPIADGRYWCELHDDFMYYCSDAERRTD